MVGYYVINTLSCEKKWSYTHTVLLPQLAALSMACVEIVENKAILIEVLILYGEHVNSMWMWPGWISTQDPMASYLPY